MSWYVTCANAREARQTVPHTATPSTTRKGMLDRARRNSMFFFLSGKRRNGQEKRTADPTGAIMRILQITRQVSLEKTRVAQFDAHTQNGSVSVDRDFASHAICLPGDANGDEATNLDDIPSFVDAIMNSTTDPS